MSCLLVCCADMDWNEPTEVVLREQSLEHRPTQ